MVEYKYPLEKNGKIICQECGKPFFKMVSLHTKSHGMTLKEYYEKYPDTPRSTDSSKAIDARFASKTDIFKENVNNKSNAPDEHITFDLSILEKKEKSIPIEIDTKDLNLKGVPEHKVGVLKFLHGIYKNLENNYIIKKLDIQNKIDYQFMTDMADPVRKIVFDFPNAFWHNDEIVPDPNKFQKLKKDGWEIIIVDNKPPTIKDIQSKIPDFAIEVNYD